MLEHLVKSWWITFFAPSGADNALPFLRQHFTLPDGGAPSPPQAQPKRKASTGKKGAPALPTAKIAVIGPTTASHVRDTLKLEVTAIATQPSPEALANAVKAAI